MPIEMRGAAVNDELWHRYSLTPVSAGAAPGENFLRCTNCYSGSTRPGRKEFYFSAWNQGIAPIEWRLAPPLLNGARRRSARMFKGGAP